MTSSDWNTAIIEEFHANEGRVGGQFAGANMILMHHVGRSSGREYIAPVVYFTDRELPSAEPGTMYVIASAAGAPQNPQWYANMLAAGRATVEVGIETFEVDVADVEPATRERIFAEVKKVAPGFGDYERKLAGARIMPILALHRR